MKYFIIEQREGVPEMKKSIVIAIVGVLAVAGVGSAVYFQTIKDPKVGNTVASAEQNLAIPSADDMEAQVKEVVAAKEAELETQKVAEEEAARVAAEQAAQEKEQVADSNTSTKENATAKSNKSSDTGAKGKGSSSGKGNSSASTSSNEENPYGFTEDDLPDLAPGTTIDIGEPTRSYDIPGGGTANVYDHISDDELNEHLN